MRAERDCEYEGCAKLGCSQERILGLTPCKHAATPNVPLAIALIVLLVPLLFLIQYL